MPTQTKPFAPTQLSDTFIERTRAFWQPHSVQPLTHEDAREIVQNVSTFASVLAEWREEAGVET